MRRVIAAFVCLTLAVGLSACARQSTPPRTEPEPVLAQEFITKLRQENYAQAASMFNKELKAKVSVEALQEIWQGLNGQLGGLTKVGTPQTEQVEQYVAIAIPVEFSTAVVTMRVVFDSHKEIGGLHFSAPQSTLQYDPPTYVDTTKFTEREVVVGSSEWALPGTVSTPTGIGPFPGIILVHGSGPNDRDETILGNKPFKDLAQGLASQGIVVLRYDKRTLVHGQKMNAVTVTPHDEVVEDAVLAARMLLALPEVDPEQIFILGHSLGGFLAPQITMLFPEARGTVILAAPSRPLEDVILEQYQYIFSLDGILTSIEKQHLKELEAQIKRVKAPSLSTKTATNLLPAGMPASYWLYLRQYNPVAVAASLSQNMLILQGEQDYQVTMVDYTGWQSIQRPNVLTKSYPRLNHLFMAGEGEGLSQPSDYENIGYVDEIVIRDIAAWVHTKEPSP
ncbi:MAG: hypothetical protein FD169_509 [Bacillota bacterium]|nr:MAG: hypothetical protein FD169_509 [Bacillota bacterium]